MARRRPLDEQARAVVEEVRTSLFGTVGLSESELDGVLRVVADRARVELRGSPSADDIRRIAGKAFTDYAVDLSHRTRSLVQTGLSSGVDAAARSIQLATGKEATSEQLGRAAIRAASDRLRQRTIVRDVPLSTRIRRGAENMGTGMSAQLQASIRAGESMRITAERVASLSPGSVLVPRYVRELQAAARDARAAGDVSHYDRVVDRFRAQLNRLGEGDRRDGSFSLRSAGRQLVRELRTAKDASIDTIVDRWILDKAKWQAARIARTETIEAYRAAFRERVQDDPSVVGIRWELSQGHPRMDVCDVFAGQDLHGLGAGGYLKSDVPPNPHPFCACLQTAILDDAFQDRELARLRGQPEPPESWKSGQRVTGDEWLRAQPTSVQREILGATRAKMLARGETVLDARGAPIPLWQLQGRPRPPLRGEFVDAGGLVKIDREAMVEPLGELSTLVNGPVILPPSPPPPPTPRARKSESTSSSSTVRRIRRPRPRPKPASPAAIAAAYPTTTPEPAKTMSSPVPVAARTADDPARTADDPRSKKAGQVPIARTLKEALDEFASVLGRIYIERHQELNGLGDALDVTEAGGGRLTYEHQELLRNAARRVVQTAYPMLGSSDLRRFARSKNTMPYAIGMVEDSQGIHGWDGEILLSRKNTELLLRAGRAMYASQALERPGGLALLDERDDADDIYGALKTLFHETIHEHSIITKMSYIDAGAFLEEGSTEFLARTLMIDGGLRRDGTPTAIGWGGSYQKYVASLLAYVRRGDPSETTMDDATNARILRDRILESRAMAVRASLEKLDSPTPRMIDPDLDFSRTDMIRFFANAGGEDFADTERRLRAEYDRIVWGRGETE